VRSSIFATLSDEYCSPVYRVPSHDHDVRCPPCLGTDHLTSRGGVVWFFSKKNILIPNVAEKNILILVEEKKI